MIEVQSVNYQEIFEIYDDKIQYFPIVCSIVEQTQNGYLFYEDGLYCIVHKFGFSYILNSSKQQKTTQEYFSFIQNLRALLKGKVDTLRIYDPKGYIGDELKENRSLRVKLAFDSINELIENQSFYLISELNNSFENLFNLDLCNRFWSNCLDFKNKSNGVVYSIENQLKGICYSAAVANSFTEIDIYVDPDSRNNNIGQNLAKFYINNLQKEALTPLWDCYENNVSSYKLAQKLGFKKQFEYNYYNVKV